MAISSTWRPNPAHGAYTVTRRVVVTAAAGFSKIDFRNTSWFGNCPWLAMGGHTAAQAVARGVLRKVSIRFVPNAETASTSGTSEALHVADEDPGAGGDAFMAAANDGIPFVRQYNPRMERTYIWTRAPSATGADVAVDLEVEYDVPDAA